MNYCPKCGERIENGDFCAKCGTNVKDVAKVVEENNGGASDGKVLMLIDIGILAAIITISFLSVSPFWNMPLEMSKALLGAVAPLSLAFFVITIIGKIKYKKVVFFKVMFIIMMVEIAIFLIYAAFIIITCYSCISSLGEMGLIFR